VEEEAWRRRHWHLYLRKVEPAGRLQPGAKGTTFQDRTTLSGARLYDKKVQAARCVERLVELIEPQHKKISVRRQCQLLGTARSSVAYVAAEENPDDPIIKLLLDQIYMKDPSLGSRRLVTVLKRDHGHCVNRKRIQRLRTQMGVRAIYCEPRTTIPDKTHTIYPYLLRNLEIVEPDHVWCADITYVPMAKGSAYLCAVMDWATRKVLGWAVGNTMDVGLCTRALTMAKQTAGSVPMIMNTDQGSQFTSEQWTTELKRWGTKISMDGRGRWMDNVFIERLWRSLKYEDIYLRDYRTVAHLEAGIDRWMEQYNNWRPHASLANETPAAVYLRKKEKGRAAHTESKEERRAA
jgi:putative transposase